MGLFKKIKKTVKKAVTKAKNPVSTVKGVASKALQNPARYTAAVLSGGTTELLRKAPVVGKVYGSAFDQVYAPAFNAAANYETFGLSGQLQAATARGGSMAFNVGGFLGAVGNVLGNVQGGNAGSVRAVGSLLQIGSASIVPKQNNAIKKTPMPGAQSSVPALMSNLGAVSIPANVATAGQWLLAKMGVKVKSASSFLPALKRTMAAIASFARRTPTGSIVSVLIGLGLSVNLANELVAWYATKRKRRRMNPANARALNRAARRIKSFHRLCQHTDLIKTRSRSRSYTRCGTCRKSPCSC